MKTLLKTITQHRDFTVALNYLVHRDEENFKDWFKFRFKNEALQVMDDEGYEWYEAETFINDVHYRLLDELEYELEATRAKRKILENLVNNPELWEEALITYQYKKQVLNRETIQVIEALMGLGI